MKKNGALVLRMKRGAGIKITIGGDVIRVIWTEIDGWNQVALLTCAPVEAKIDRLPKGEADEYLHGQKMLKEKRMRNVDRELEARGSGEGELDSGRGVLESGRELPNGGRRFIARRSKV